MSGVVLRCPHCGTVKGSPGECEACSEAQVRYFCTNHSPGRWIDAPACPQCGARFGEPERPPAPPTPPARREPPPRRPPPASAPSPRRPASTVFSKIARSPWGRARTPPRIAEDAPAFPGERGPRPMTLPELLRAARRRPAPDRFAPDPPHAVSVSPVVGFIRRAVMLVVFLVIGLLVFGLLAGGPLLEVLLSLLLTSGRY